MRICIIITQCRKTIRYRLLIYSYSYMIYEQLYDIVIYILSITIRYMIQLYVSSLYRSHIFRWLPMEVPSNKPPKIAWWKRPISALKGLGLPWNGIHSYSICTYMDNECAHVMYQFYITYLYTYKTVHIYISMYLYIYMIYV